MNSTGFRLQTKVAEMRRAFDESFAAPQRDDEQSVEHMLAVEVAGDRFAVRVADISGLTIAKGTILRVPSRAPELLGITGIRGVVVPVFSLAALLGISPAAGHPRWLVLCGGRQAPIALAIERVEGHLDIPVRQIFACEAERAHRYVNETARDGSVLRGVIDISQLVEHIKAQGATAPPSRKKES